MPDLKPYPEELIKELHQREYDGCDIFCTQTEFETVWIVKDNQLENWIDIFTWTGDSDEFQQVNIIPSTFDRLLNVMIECKNEKDKADYKLIDFNMVKTITFKD